MGRSIRRRLSPSRWLHATPPPLSLPQVTEAFEKYQPDLVVSVHPLMQHVPIRVLKGLAKQGRPETPFATVVTDLTTCHPTWFHPDVTKLFVPTEEASVGALWGVGKGMGASAAATSGRGKCASLLAGRVTCPWTRPSAGPQQRAQVRRRLEQDRPARAAYPPGVQPGPAVQAGAAAAPGAGPGQAHCPARRRWGGHGPRGGDRQVPGNVSSVLRCRSVQSRAPRGSQLGPPLPLGTIKSPAGPALNGNGGPIRRAARPSRYIGSDLQLVVVCGRNQKLVQRLKSLSYPPGMNVVVNGFVDNMADWMGACDTIITKAGPGTIAEALICGLPLMLNGYIPCQVRVPRVSAGGSGSLGGQAGC